MLKKYLTIVVIFIMTGANSDLAACSRASKLQIDSATAISDVIFSGTVESVSVDGLLN